MDSSGDETFNENISDGSTSSKKTYPNASDMGEGTMMKQDRSFRGISGSERLAAESKITGKPFGVRIEGVSLDENYHRKEAELWQAKKRARRTIGRDQMTDDDKCIERRAANRLAAFQSRQRKKAIIEELQGTITKLSHESSTLQNHVDEVRAECDELKRENAKLLSRLSEIDNAPAQRIARLCTDNRQAGLFDTISALISSFGNNNGAIPDEVIVLMSELLVLQELLTHLRARQQVSLGSEDSGYSNNGSASVSQSFIPSFNSGIAANQDPGPTPGLGNTAHDHHGTSSIHRQIEAVNQNLTLPVAYVSMNMTRLGDNTRGLVDDRQNDLLHLIVNLCRNLQR